MTYLHGVDVSSHQTGWTPDDGDHFVFVKATEGRSYVNPAHDDQIAAGRAGGLVVGHYHWLTTSPVEDQVDYFLANVELQPGDLVALDWEDSDYPSCAMKDQWLAAVKARIPEHRVGLYCNRDWWHNRDTTNTYGDFLWIAVYGEPDPGIQADWRFWQYSDTPIDQNHGDFASVAELRAWAGLDDPPTPEPPPEDSGYWFSTDYLFPKLPNPENPHGVAEGDRVEVTATGGLKARTLPGGPQSLDDSGEPLVRPPGYEFEVTAELVDGWATGGTNWYSTDYLTPVADPPPPTTPQWSSKPTIVFDDPTPDPDRNVSYLQACVRVGPVDTDDGDHYDETFVICQDLENKGNLRFARFYPDGTYTDEWMMVNDAGHGQTFHAYRSAAGNLYVWCGEDPAYRYRWQPGKTVAKTSGDKMDYKGSRPVGSHEPWVGFRNATDTRETFYLFDRTDFTDGSNQTSPAKTITVDKRTNYTQQSWAVTADRIYRIMGSTNDDPPHGTRLHILDVFDWSGRLLLDRFDITAMSIDSSSDEPEGVTFTGTPGNLLAGKREGSSDPGKRSYPVWTITGLP